MAKPTLLDEVQSLLADADGDEVNSINDTIESDQAARIIRDSFRNLVDIHDFSLHKQWKQLDATSSTTPTQMDRPDGVYDIEKVTYDKRATASDDPTFQTVTYMDPLDFMRHTGLRAVSGSAVVNMAMTNGFNVLIRNDAAPTYYTQLESYDEFVFDSYDVALETNLQQSKTMVYCKVKPTLSLTDGAVIDLPENLFTLLRNDARAFFFDLYKDGVTKEIDKRQRRSEVRAQRQRHMTKNKRELQTGPNYGRKRR